MRRRPGKKRSHLITKPVIGLPSICPEMARQVENELSTSWLRIDATVSIKIRLVPETYEIKDPEIKVTGFK
jgi:hypothetical protein